MSLRILHTADWHLGKKLDHFSRLEEQKLVMAEICDIADVQNVDVVIVAGDLFDTFNPPAEAQDLFYKTLFRLTNNGKRAVVAIAGNHDMPERVEAPNPLAEMNGIILCGFPDTEIKPFTTDGGIEVTRSEAGFLEIKMAENQPLLRVIFTPYANELRLKTYLGMEKKESALREILEEKWRELADKYCDSKGVNVLTAHLFFMKKGGQVEAEPEGEKSILHVGGAQPIFSENIPKQMQYVALGHLHRYHSIDKIPCPIVYSSSPLSYSFAEADQKKQVVIIDLEPGKAAKYEPIPLTQGRGLTRKEFASIEDAVSWLVENPEVYVEVTIQTDTFLDGTARKQLSQAQNYIVDVIPKIRLKEGETEEIYPFEIDDSRDMNALFVEFFNYKNGNEAPPEALLQLFKEVISQNSEI
jgi:exonuclease SbcD